LSNPCAGCEFDWDTGDHAGLIGAIERAPRAVTALVADRSLATLRRRPDPDTWSPLEYTVHLGTALDFYANRIELVLTTDRPQLHGFDFAAACDRDRYDERSLEEALDLVTLAARRLVTLLQPLAPEQWQRVGIGSEGDERTVEALARRAAHEAEHHLLDIRRELD
jgi:hypothetical protein